MQVTNTSFFADVYGMAGWFLGLAHGLVPRLRVSVRREFGGWGGYWAAPLYADCAPMESGAR